MGKLVDTYNSKKKENNNCLYIIHSGVFYICINEDAKKLNELLQLKITNIDNDGNIKYGFPTSRIDFYKNILDKINIKYEIVEIQNLNQSIISKKNNKEMMKIINYISNLNLDDISHKDAYKILEKLNRSCKNFNGES